MSSDSINLDINYLKAALLVYPLSVWLGFWRAMELALLSQTELVDPVLDLGCGTGLLAYTLLRGTPDLKFDAHTFYRLKYVPAVLPAAVCLNLIGIDLDGEAISRAIKLHLYHGLVCADAKRLPFAQQSFSTVVSNCVVEHIPDLDGLLAQVSDLLREGGRFIFTVPTDTLGRNLVLATLYRRLGRSDLYTRHVAKRNQCLEHYNTLSLKQWECRLNEVGLEVTDFRYYLLPHAERVWDLLYMVQNSWAGSYGFAVAERAYSWAWSHLPGLGQIKRAWVHLLVRLLKRYHQASTTCGGGLLIVAIKGRSQKRDALVQRRA